jgi:hypothetical protein
MKRGEYFEHRYWLRPDMSGAKLICKITKLTSYGIYYRPHYGWHDDGSEWLGRSAYFRRDRIEISRYMGPIVQQPSCPQERSEAREWWKSSP